MGGHCPPYIAMANLKIIVSKLAGVAKYISFNTKRKYEEYIVTTAQKLQTWFLYNHSNVVYKKDLIIIDDYVPNIYAAFKPFEIAFLLNAVESSALFSVVANRVHDRYYPTYDIHSTKHFKKLSVNFCSAFKVPEEKVKPFYPWTKIDAKVVYVIFLNVAWHLLEYLEKRKLKFILELYPGGGLSLLESGPDYEKLKAVLGSPCLVNVICTQKITYEFVKKHKFCSDDKVSFKYGGVIANIPSVKAKSLRYKTNKKTLDICFTAAKYMEKGLDKGYDIFIEAAHMLLEKNKAYHFHIVGGFDENEIPVKEEFREHFHFYGFLKSTDFIQYYSDKDIIVSPNRPFMLGKGNFDGFPTGAVGEAALNGLCMIISDPLNLNPFYKDFKDAIFIENIPEDIAEKVSYLEQNPDEIYRIGEAGKQTIIADNATQLPYRLNMIKSAIE